MSSRTGKYFGREMPIFSLPIRFKFQKKLDSLNPNKMAVTEKKVESSALEEFYCQKYSPYHCSGRLLRFRCLNHLQIHF